MQFFSMLHSSPKVFKLRDRLLRTVSRGHEVFKIPQWLINRGIRDILVFNMRRKRFRIGGAKKSQARADRAVAAGEVGPQASLESLASDQSGYPSHVGVGLRVEDSIHDY